MDPKDPKDPKAGNLAGNLFGNLFMPRVLFLGVIACIVALSYYFGFAGSEFLFLAGPVGDKDKDKDKDKNKDDPKNVKALQKLLTEADKKIKGLEKKFEEKVDQKKTEDQSDVSKLDELSGKITSLTDQIVGMNQDKKRAQLKELFPDIHPDLLLDKTDEQIENLVKSQRGIAKKIYGDASIFSEKIFETMKDVNTAQKAVLDNKQISGEDSAVEILKLGREKSKLLSSD